MSLNMKVRLTHGFEFDMPDLNHTFKLLNRTNDLVKMTLKQKGMIRNKQSQSLYVCERKWKEGKKATRKRESE